MSGAERHLHKTVHDEAWALLPWYVNGSLGSGEQDAVRAHAGACLTCARELRRLQLLARALDVPGTDYACGQAFARLEHRLDRQRRGGRVRAALAAVFAPVPLVAGAALLLCSSLIVASIVLSGGDDGLPREQPFQTLGRQAGSDGRLGAPTLRVVLRDDGARADWLARHHAELVDGPSAIGVMTVRVALGPQRLDDVVADLRADDHTLFVEPVSLIGHRPDRQR